MKSLECMDVRFSKEHLSKVSVTSKAANCGPASLIKINTHTYSSRIQSTGADKLDSKTPHFRTCVSTESLLIVAFNEQELVNRTHITPAKEVSCHQSRRL